MFPSSARMPPKASESKIAEDPEMQRLLNRFSTMRAFYTKSPFHLRLQQQQKVEGSVPDVLRHLDVGSSVDTSVKHAQTPLHQVAVLHTKYLPEELYSAKDQQASMAKRSAAFFQAHGHLHEEKLQAKLKQLAEEDAKTKDQAEDDDEQAAPKEEEIVEEEDEDDELDHEDDDYYQGEHFDDDEEYGDDGDDGDGEAYF